MDVIWLALALAALAALERSPRLRRQPARLLRAHFAADLAFLATGALGVALLVRFAAGRAAAMLGVAPLVVWHPLATLLATLVAFDFAGWLVHVVEHRFEALWRVHKVHHASPHLDWLATFRMHPLEHLARQLASPGLLVLLGFPAAQVALASLLTGAWAAFVHANLDLGWPLLERLLITPRLHHLHHVPASCDKNFGAFFSFWDRLAGTFAGNPAARTALLGVPGEEHGYPNGWWAQWVEPFRARVVAPAPNRSPVPLRQPE